MTRYEENKKISGNLNNCREMHVMNKESNELCRV